MLTKAMRKKNECEPSEPKKLSFANVYEFGNVFNMFVRPQGYTQCVKWVT